MPLPKHSAAFRDVKEVMDFAILNGGARYELPSGGKAVHWRQRFYYVRKLMRKENDSGYGPIVTPYDDIVLSTDPNDERIVVITINKAKGRLSTLEGLPAAATSNTPVDPLLAEAADFRARLMGKKV